MEGEMMDEMAPMMAAEEKPMEEVDEDGISIAREHELTPCCCCLCACSNEYTRGSSCCGCFPIKCGIVTTGILTLLLILSSFIEIFYFILNDYIHWWFVLVAVLLLIPAIIGACFLVTFFN